MPYMMKFGRRQSRVSCAKELARLLRVQVPEPIPGVVDAKILWWQPEFGIEGVRDSIDIGRPQPRVTQTPASRLIGSFPSNDQNLWMALGGVT
jgi:hypothetical protein